MRKPGFFDTIKIIKNATLARNISLFPSEQKADEHKQKSVEHLHMAIEWDFSNSAKDALDEFIRTHKNVKSYVDFTNRMMVVPLFYTSFGMYKEAVHASNFLLNMNHSLKACPDVKYSDADYNQKHLALSQNIIFCLGMILLDKKAHNLQGKTGENLHAKVLDSAMEILAKGGSVNSSIFGLTGSRAFYSFIEGKYDEAHELLGYLPEKQLKEELTSAWGYYIVADLKRFGFPIGEWDLLITAKLEAKSAKPYLSPTIK